MIKSVFESLQGLFSDVYKIELDDFSSSAAQIMVYCDSSSRGRKSWMVRRVKAALEAEGCSYYGHDWVSDSGALFHFYY